MRVHSRLNSSEARRLTLLWLAALVCYLDAFLGSFQFDDYNVIVNNPNVHDWRAWFAHVNAGLRPLLNFTYTLDWTLGNGAVFDFHLTNLLLHGVNGYLVYRLSGVFVRQQTQHEQLRDVPFYVALLFAVHPAHSEAVTYICGRSTELMTTFYLGAVLAYAIGRAQNRALYVYGITPLLFVIALSVKETAVTLPLALLLWEWFRGGNAKTILKTQWTCWLVLSASAFFFLLNPSYVALLTHSVSAHGLSENFATQLSAYAWLMRQWALPLWLNIDPDLPRLQMPALLPLLFFICVCAAIVRFRRERSWIAFALLWSVVHLFVLYVFLPRADIANERELYPASWPLLLALCCELALHFDTRNFHRIAMVCVVALAMLTVLRNLDYRNEMTLWESAARLSPHKARVHNNLGYAYLLAGRREDARREFNTALTLQPDDVKAKNNLRQLN